MGSVMLVEGPDSGVETLLLHHHQAMSEATPAESCHVMTSQALQASGAMVFALKDVAGAVQAVGALKPFGANSVELKSMHVAAQARGRGYGKQVLTHLLQEARSLGKAEAYLETGSEAGFAPARGLYERAGFTYCPPFAAYIADPLSVFMRLAL